MGPVSFVAVLVASRLRTTPLKPTPSGQLTGHIPADALRALLIGAILSKSFNVADNCTTFVGR
jgi:hypothetical protein